MKPVGKVLCATAFVIGFLAVFWKDSFKPERLSGARVLLTGASAGIGEQMAYHYARFGAQIVLTARRGAVLQKVMEKCLTLGAKKIFYIPADMSNPLEPEKVVHFAVQKLGGLDYLVLNHIGMTRFQMWDGDVEYTRWLMQFALDGFFSSLRHELSMQKRNISVTLCILGLIDTESALESTRGKVSLPASPAPNAALAIIQGGAMRVREVFYPGWLHLVCCLGVLFPCDPLLQSFYSPQGDPGSSPIPSNPIPAPVVANYH